MGQTMDNGKQCEFGYDSGSCCLQAKKQHFPAPRHWLQRACPEYGGTRPWNPLLCPIFLLSSSFLSRSIVSDLYGYPQRVRAHRQAAAQAGTSFVLVIGGGELTPHPRLVCVVWAAKVELRSISTLLYAQPPRVQADRRPIDPPPIVQLRVITHHGGNPQTPAPPTGGNGQSYLQNPYYFMFASLASPDSDEELHLLKDGKTRCTTGSVVSSLYHLKDSENGGQDAGFFVFPDLSVRTEGSYRLKLTLFEVVG